MSTEMMELQSSLPAMKSLSGHVESSFATMKLVEEKIVVLLQEDQYAKDSKFLIEAHKELSSSTVATIEAQRRYLDSFTKFIGATRAPPAPSVSAPVPGSNKAGAVSKEDYQESLGNSSFGPDGSHPSP